MHATTVAVDLAKNVFQLAIADSQWRVVETHRLTRSQFERWFVNRDVSLVVMEACGSAHHWARYLLGLGIEVKLLPAKYVRAYVKRNKTDAADAAALLEAARASDITPVRVKSVEQQALQGLHRTRSLWMGTRTSRINARLQGIALRAGDWFVNRHCNGGGDFGRGRSLSGCPSFRQLVRPHAQGVFLGQCASPRADLQARRPLSSDAAHPRRTCGATGSYSGQTGGATDRRPQGVGIEGAGPNPSQ